MADRSQPPPNGADHPRECRPQTDSDEQTLADAQQNVDGQTSTDTQQGGEQSTDTQHNDGEQTPTNTQQNGGKRLRIAAAALVVIGVLALTALLALGLTNRSSPTGRSGATRIHKPAPPINISLYNGGGISPERYAGKPLVVNFWASWCGPCRQEAPLFERLWREYGERGVVFIGVNIQDAHADARAYLSEFGITYPNGYDEGGRISVDYGVIGIPVTFFINREGIVERRWVGAVREAKLRLWIDELARGAAPSPDDAESANTDEYRPLR